MLKKKIAIISILFLSLITLTGCYENQEKTEMKTFLNQLTNQSFYQKTEQPFDHIPGDFTVYLSTVSPRVYYINESTTTIYLRVLNQRSNMIGDEQTYDDFYIYDKTTQELGETSYGFQGEVENKTKLELKKSIIQTIYPEEDQINDFNIILPIINQIIQIGDLNKLKINGNSIIFPVHSKKLKSSGDFIEHLKTLYPNNHQEITEAIKNLPNRDFTVRLKLASNQKMLLPYIDISAMHMRIYQII